MRALVRLTAASLGTSAACAAFADEPNPYYIGAAQAFTHESNLFRVATGQAKTSDTYSTTSLLAGLNQPISRQRLFADLAAHYNRYNDQDRLNNTGYNVNVGAELQTVENISGLIAYTANRTLARFGADEGPPLTTKNLEKDQEFVLNGQYGAVGPLSLQAGYTNRRLDYSAVEFAPQEFKQDTGRVAMLYRPGGTLTLGIGGRYTNGKYPFALESAPGVFVQDNFKRNDLDLSAVWVITGQSTLTLRFTHTNEDHDEVESRNVSEGTGLMRWDYKPTGKLSFVSEYARDTGAEAVFTRLDPRGSPGNTNNNSRISDTLLFRGVYEATAKIQAQVDARYVRRQLVNTFALTNGGSSIESGSDRLGELKLGINYVPTRSVLIGCAYGYERRGTNSALSYGYIASIASCMAQFKLQ
jgi:hypothetical protein